MDVDVKQQLLEVKTVSSDGTSRNIYVPYDKLVIAVGSVSATHGVPGLENCFQLKTIADSIAMRRRILDNFEAASLPTTTPEDRKRLLSFVICGGGPTGVETAAVRDADSGVVYLADLVCRRCMTFVRKIS